MEEEPKELTREECIERMGDIADMGKGDENGNA